MVFESGGFDAGGEVDECGAECVHGVRDVFGCQAAGQIKRAAEGPNQSPVEGFPGAIAVVQKNGVCGRCGSRYQIGFPADAECFPDRQTGFLLNCFDAVSIFVTVQLDHIQADLVCCCENSLR